MTTTRIAKAAIMLGLWALAVALLTMGPTEASGAGGGCDVTGDICPDSTWWESGDDGFGTRVSTHEFSGVDDEVFELKYNLDQDGIIDSGQHTYGLQIEGDYYTGSQHFTELHLQYENGATTRRPLGTAIDTSSHAATVNIKGKLGLYDSTGAQLRVDCQDQTGIGGCFIYSTYLGWVGAQKMLRAWVNSQWVDMVEVDSAGDVVLRDRVHIADTAPTVADCGELIEALDSMGLVVDGR